MTVVWDERAEAYRQSPTHAGGPDLDLLVRWAGDGAGRQALDVATGGGHLARHLGDAGFVVTTLDPSPAMRPTVIARAEALPFADGSFDVVATRLAAHHFDDVAAAVSELARVARGVVLVEDLLFVSEDVELAEKLRDPSHIRSYSEEEWRGLLAGASLDVEEVVMMERTMPHEAWLALCRCEGEEAERVTELLGDRVRDGVLTIPTVLLRGRKHA